MLLVKIYGLKQGDSEQGERSVLSKQIYDDHLSKLMSLGSTE